MKILKLIAVFVAVLSMTLSIPAAVHAAPDVPAITSPTDGQLLTVYTPSIFFQWTATIPAGGSYDIEISTDATFLNSAAIVDSSDHSHNPLFSCTRVVPNLPGTYAYQPATTYYVRIQAYDSTCNGDFTTGGSGWSDSVFYTSLATPTLLAPGNGSTLVNNMTNNDTHVPPELFQWASVVGATGYILEVSTATDFTSLYIDTTIPAGQTYYTPTGDLPATTTFYWQVQAIGDSPYSPSGWGFCGTGNCSFTTANAASPAPAPIKIQPGPGPNAKVTNDFNPGLRWNEIALPGGTTFTTYEVEVGTDPTFLDSTALCFDVNSGQVSSLQYQTYPTGMGLTTVEFDTGVALANTPVAPGANCPATWGVGGKFAPATDFSWRVRAVDSGGYSDWSSVAYFRTSYSKPDSTTFSTTGDPIGHTITFSWATVPGAYAYSLLGCLDFSFIGNCPLNVTKIGPPYTWWMNERNKPFGSGVLIHWRVRAEGPFGPSLWSVPNPLSDVITP